MANTSYSPEALAKYSLLINATFADDLGAVKELLKDESIDIHTLIPPGDDDLTSAVALAIDSGSDDMIEAFLTHPKMEFSRSIGKFKSFTFKFWKSGLFHGEKAWSDFTVINYALFKENFKLAENLIKEGKCNWTGQGIILSAYFYLKNAQSHKFMELIAVPNAEIIRALSIDDKMEFVNLFKHFKLDPEVIFDMCFPKLEENCDFDFWEWFYRFNISEEWFEKLKQKDMLKHLNDIDKWGESLIMRAA